jgi:RimJ/RimL family protein N-acetyltransferase
VAKLPDVLQSGAVTLRRWSTEYIGEVSQAVEASFPELHRWMPWAQSMPSEAEFFTVFRQGELSFDADREWQYLLFDDSDTVVGAAGLHNRGDINCPEIGYWVRSDRTGRGYATAAAKALVEAAFTYLDKIAGVQIHMDRANLASAAIPPKLGFRLVGEEEREILTEGHTGSGYVWVIDRPE